MSDFDLDFAELSPKICVTLKSADFDLGGSDSAPKRCFSIPASSAVKDSASSEKAGVPGFFPLVLISLRISSTEKLSLLLSLLISAPSFLISVIFHGEH